MKRNYFSFLGSWKSWKVIRICVQKINVKIEKSEITISINKRELQPIINIANLIKLGVKIVGPMGITDSEKLKVIVPEDIAKMELILPKVNSTTGEIIGRIKTTFPRIRFEDCQAKENGSSDWFCARGCEYSITDSVVNGIVKNLFELEAYAQGSKFILE